MEHKTGDYGRYDRENKEGEKHRKNNNISVLKASILTGIIVTLAIAGFEKYQEIKPAIVAYINNTRDEVSATIDDIIASDTIDEIYTEVTDANTTNIDSDTSDVTDAPYTDNSDIF